MGGGFERVPGRGSDVTADTETKKSSAAAAPGKRTLTEQLAPQAPLASGGPAFHPMRSLIEGPDSGDVQRSRLDPGYGDLVTSAHASVQRTASATAARSTDDADIKKAAAQGVVGAGGLLPHGRSIQQLFGRHDVSGIQAHVGGAAETASRAISAEAYATGNHVAFARAPDLHTAAHEAAHVVQQRGSVQLKGGVGEADDAYERHADAVADAVVQGKSAEGLLDHVAGASQAPSGASMVQRQPDKLKKEEDPDADVSLGILDSSMVDAAAAEMLGETGWTVMRELLRGIRGGFQSMPANQRAQIEAKFNTLGVTDVLEYAEGYGLGILEGLGLGIKSLGDAVVTLVTLPYEVNRFLVETVPELAAKYGPRLAAAMNEAGGLSSHLTSALADVLHHPAQLGELIEAFKGMALTKVRALGHGIAGKIVGLAAEPWYDYGLDVGKVVGQVLFEVLLAVASDAIANLVKEVLSLIGRLLARLLEGAIEVFRTLRRLLGEAVALLGKLVGRMTGKLAEAFKDVEGLFGRLGAIFEDLAGERALADTGTGVHVPIPDAKGPTVLEARSVKPPGGGTGPKVEDLTPPKVHPSKVEADVGAAKPKETSAAAKGAEGLGTFDDAIAQHILEGGRHFRGQSKEQILALIKKVRAEGEVARAGNGKAITRLRDIVLIDDPFTKGGTMFKPDRPVAAYIRDFLEDNR